MRPRLGPAIADLATHATAGPSRWTDRVGVTGRARERHPHLRRQTSWHLDNERVVSAEQGDGANSWRVFLPLDVPKARLRHRGRDALSPPP